MKIRDIVFIVFAVLPAVFMCGMHETLEPVSLRELRVITIGNLLTNIDRLQIILRASDDELCDTYQDLSLITTQFRWEDLSQRALAQFKTHILEYKQHNCNHENRMRCRYNPKLKKISLNRIISLDRTAIASYHNDLNNLKEILLECLSDYKKNINKSVAVLMQLIIHFSRVKQATIDQTLLPFYSDNLSNIYSKYFSSFLAELIIDLRKILPSHELRASNTNKTIKIRGRDVKLIEPGVNDIKYTLCDALSENSHVIFPLEDETKTPAVLEKTKSKMPNLARKGAINTAILKQQQNNNEREDLQLADEEDESGEDILDDEKDIDSINSDDDHQQKEEDLSPDEPQPQKIITQTKQKKLSKPQRIMKESVRFLPQTSENNFKPQEISSTKKDFKLSNVRLTATTYKTFELMSDKSYQTQVSVQDFKNLISAFINKNKGTYLDKVNSLKATSDNSKIAIGDGMSIFFVRKDGKIAYLNIHYPHERDSYRMIPVGFREAYMSVFESFAIKAENIEIVK